MKSLPHLWIDPLISEGQLRVFEDFRIERAYQELASLARRFSAIKVSIVSHRQWRKFVVLLRVTMLTESR
jgi:hypothetical protein